MKFLKGSLLLAAAIAATQSFGTVYQVHSRTSLGIHLEPFNFPPYELPFTTQPSWAATVDTHQLIARMDNGRNAWYLNQASGPYGTWVGNFFQGQKLVFVDAPTPPTTFFFATPDAAAANGFDRIQVAGFGLQIQTQTPGAFTAQIRAYDTTAAAWSPWFSVNGNSTGTADGTAVFLGIGSTARNLAYVQVRAKSTTGNTAYGWWAVNAPNIAIAPSPSPSLVTVSP